MSEAVENVRALKIEREAHISAIAGIDAQLEEIRVALGGKLPRVKRLQTGETRRRKPCYAEGGEVPAEANVEPQG